MAEIKNTDPYRNARYQLQIAGQTVADFSEVILPGDESEEGDSTQAAGSEMLSKLSGLTNYGELTLKRGMTHSLELQRWYEETELTGTSTMQKDVTLVFVDEAGNQSLTWRIIGAWPSSFQIAELKATGSAVMIMSLVLQLESIELVS